MKAPDWDEVIERHLNRQSVERGLGRNSREAYGHDLREFQIFCRKSGVEPATIEPRTLTGYLESLADRGLSPATQRRHLASIRGLIRELAEREILERDPSVNLKLRPYPRRLPRTMTRADVAMLLEAIGKSTLRGLRDRAMVELAYGSGLRVSELVGIKLQQMNLGAGLIVVLGKGNKERVVPIGGASKRALREYLHERSRPVEGKPAARAAKPNAAVFLSRFGRPMTRQAFFKSLKGYASQRPAPRMDQSAHAQALLRHASAGGWRGLARGAGDARPQRHLDYADLHAPVQEPSAQGPSHVPSARHDGEGGRAQRGARLN